MNQVSWVLRKFRKGDESKIKKLAIEAFGKDLLPEKLLDEFWTWEFEKDPVGKSRIWVADDNGKIVGHYAHLPVRLKIQEILSQAGLVVDVMTHSQYRFQGMFTRLGRSALEDAGKHGFHFSLGFPMEGSTAKIVLPGHFKVGWFIAFTIPVYVRPLNFEAILTHYLKNEKIARLGKILNPLYDRIVNLVNTRFSSNSIKTSREKKFGLEIDRFWEIVSKDYEIIRIRNSLWLNYRFSNVPGRDYTILFAKRNNRIFGYIVLRRVKRAGLNFGLIVDLLTKRNDVEIRRILISKAIEHFRASELDAIGCMVSNSAYQRDLRALGFIRSNEKYYFILHLNSNLFKREYLQSPKRWFLTWGDLDTI